MAGKKTRSEASTSRGGGGGNGDRGESVVMDVGRRKSTCGYCRSGARTSISHGLWVDTLTVDHYQALIDRGWRRSGCFLYKPEMEKTCCPSYTIRLKASDFFPTNEQSRASKRMQSINSPARCIFETSIISRFRMLQMVSCNAAHDQNAGPAAMECSVVASEDKENDDQRIRFLSGQIDKIVQLCLKSVELPKASVKKVPPAKRKLQADISEDLIYTSSIAFQIAAKIKRTKKNIENEKSVQRVLGEKEDSEELSPKRIAEILASYSKQLGDSCGLSVRACNGHINFYSAAEQAQLVEKTGRHVITKPSHVESDKPQGQKRRLEIRLKKSCFDYEEYSLYRKYQLQVHNDTPAHVTESSYKRFLVDTPLVYVSPSDDGAVPPCGFGSFHQQYVVDGKLIAVGVFDILPKCLSSKYLFWDPDFAFLSLGKYSALEEIRWVSQNQVHCPSLQYYYLGYYIHSCSKMRYKAAYRPSELLCPLRYQWVRYDIAKPLLDRRKYVVLSDFAALQNGDSFPLNVLDNDMEEEQNSIQEEPNDVSTNDDEMAELDSEDSDDESDSDASVAATTEMEDVDLSNVLIGLKEARLRYKDLRHAFDSNQRKVLESHLQRYTRVVGSELSREMVYSLG
ncbi:Arginyl-tRNA-protein transferase [Handroanthus impetiginosus]|uniref:Arginyl-tRNA--protein transferase n=1 Tax=Handroanthus impetiginosus TaxID=429701 RepID=A0A2G9GWN3_9LAMI|nr:Arginyl-tRNA-protein transferase [Handroanthus impetiginosus]